MFQISLMKKMADLFSWMKLARKSVMLKR